MHACMHACMYVCMGASLARLLCPCRPICDGRLRRRCDPMYTSMCVCMYTCRHTRMHVCFHACMNFVELRLAQGEVGFCLCSGDFAYSQARLDTTDVRGSRPPALTRHLLCLCTGKTLCCLTATWPGGPGARVRWEGQRAERGGSDSFGE